MRKGTLSIFLVSNDVPTKIGREFHNGILVGHRFAVGKGKGQHFSLLRS